MTNDANTYGPQMTLGRNRFSKKISMAVFLAACSWLPAAALAQTLILTGETASEGEKIAAHDLAMDIGRVSGESVFTPPPEVEQIQEIIDRLPK